jgi:alanine-alpha-ketoisovalerate/valine-pyruvate aminotransferase
MVIVGRNILDIDFAIGGSCSLLLIVDTSFSSSGRRLIVSSISLSFKADVAFCACVSRSGSPCSKDVMS